MTLRLLLVEDSTTDAALMIEHLREAGLEPESERVCTDPELRAALDAGQWDVALVDFSIPGFGGPEALGILAEAAPDIPAITVSGTIDTRTAVATLKGGAVDYVLKDDLLRLAPAVQRAAEGAELRRRERLAVARAQRSQHAVDHASQAIFHLDRSGTVLYLNEATARLGGVPQAEGAGKAIWGWSPAVDEARWEEIWEATAHGPLIDLELPLTRPDGEVRTISATLERMEHEDGAFVIGYARDITAQRLVETALRTEESNLAAIFEASPVAMLVLTEELAVARVNRAALALVHADTSDLLRYHPDSDILPGTALGCVHCTDDPRACGSAEACPVCPLRNALTALLDGAGPLHGEQMMMSLGVKDGEARRVWLSVGAEPITLADEPHLILALADVTDRRQAEEALAAKAALLGKAEALSHMGSWRLDLSSGMVEWSDEMYEIFGIVRDGAREDVGDVVARAVHPDDRAVLEEVNAAVMRDGVPRPMQYRVVRPDGSVRWVNAEGEQERDASGRVVALTGFVQDITARKETEDALRESERLLEQSQYVAALGHYVFDVPAGTWTSSATLDAVFGIPGDYLRNVEGWLAIVHPDDRDDMASYLGEHVIRGHRPFDREYRIVRIEDGAERWVHGLGTLEYGAEGDVTCMFGVIQDVTERKRAEEALVESQRLFTAFAEHLPGDLWIRDAGARYAYVNPHLAGEVGAAAEALLGRPPEDVWDTEQAARVRALLARAQTGGIVDDVSLWPIRGGERIFHTRLFPISPGDGVPFVGGLAFDVTEQQQAQDEVRRQAEQLRRTVEGAVLAMSQLIEARDPYTAGHQRRVAELTLAIARALGFDGDRLESLRLAALLHDLGKISVPAEILAKPGVLSRAEFSLIRQHPRAGYDIVVSIEFAAPVADMVLQHHERHDGSGYPSGLSGESTLLEARILAVADVVEAMSSHRPYRPALGLGPALQEIRDNAGRTYDPSVAEACLRVFEEQGFRFSS